ncbi:MAG: Uma2 family endonuclease [Planctomycetota bacterium]|jgi:Uma2 family endonuclease
MGTADVLTSHTADELLEMPDSKSFELVNGVLVERNMGGLASWINGEILTLLKNHTRAENIGWVFDSEAGYQCFGKERETVRKPDVSFVRRGRLPNEELPNGHITITPDLAVEVVSPNDRVYELQSKVADYLAAGVCLVWVVNPADRSVTVYTQGSDQPVVVREGGELSGGDVLPEFRCPVSSLFPPVKE